MNADAGSAAADLEDIGSGVRFEIQDLVSYGCVVHLSRAEEESPVFTG